MRILTLFASAFFVVSLFIACTSPVEGVTVLNCKDFDEKLNKTENPQLIDVRTPQQLVIIPQQWVQVLQQLVIIPQQWVQ